MRPFLQRSRVAATHASHAAGPTSPVRFRPRQEGYGLIELLVTMAVMIVILSLTVETVLQFQRSYRAQSRLIDVEYNARAGMDMMVRLIRNAETIVADPDGNGLFDSVRLQGDWNPPDGDFDDPYETVTFTTNAGGLLKQETADPLPLPLADHVQSLTLTYFDSDGAPLADPVAQAAQIAHVRVGVTTEPRPDAPSTTLTTAVTIRLRE